MNNINMERLYREVMSDHYQNPRHKGLVNKGILTQKRNPSCGDDIKVEIEVEDGKIKHIHHDGVGCLICCSSASVMCELLEGKDVKEASKLTNEFFDMLMGKDVNDDLEEAIAYQGVSKFPARIKCAALPWKALEEDLHKEEEKKDE